MYVSVLEGSRKDKEIPICELLSYSMHMCVDINFVIKGMGCFNASQLIITHTKFLPKLLFHI